MLDTVSHITGPSLIDWSDPVTSDPLNRGLVGWWLAAAPNVGFGSVVWRDISGKSYTGALSASVEMEDWSTFNYKNNGFGSLYFDGSGPAIVDISNMAPINNVVTMPFSICCWFYAESASSQTLVSFSDSNSTDHYYDMTLLTSGGLLAEIKDTLATSAASSLSWTQNKWHFGTVVYSSATSRAAYLDGTNKGTNADGRTPNDSTIETGTIGALRRSSTIFEFQGYIAHVAIYKRALTDTDVWQLYQDSLIGYQRTLRRRPLFVPTTVPAAPAARANFLTLLGVS